jgi:hypothetical protein
MGTNNDDNDDTWIDIDMIKACVAILKHSVKPDDEVLPHAIEVEKMISLGKVTAKLIETDPHFAAITKWMKDHT